MLDVRWSASFVKPVQQGESAEAITTGSKNIHANDCTLSNKSDHLETVSIKHKHTISVENDTVFETFDRSHIKYINMR